MTEHTTFEKINFNEIELDDEYYNCVFVACDLSNKSVLKTEFDKCQFKTCNFTLAKFKESLRDIMFVDCKMTGADFSEINRFSGGLTFENSHLDYANFVTTKLRKTIFRNCKIHEAYFDDADMANSVFEHCDLERTSFVGTHLEKVDFSTSFNFSINPTMCKLKKTIFSEYGLRGLVAHLNIEIKQ